MIVVPSIALLDQWNEALLENNVNQEIVLNGGGEKVNKSAKIIVTTIDSLKNILGIVNAENSLLIVDECHKIGTENALASPKSHNFRHPLFLISKF